MIKICIILYVDTNKIAGHEDAIRSIQEMVAQAIKVSMWTDIVASEEVILHSRNQRKQQLEELYREIKDQIINHKHF